MPLATRKTFFVALLSSRSCVVAVAFALCVCSHGGCSSDGSSSNASGTAVIGPSGGTASTGSASADIPPGALAEQTVVGIARTTSHVGPPAGYDIVGGVYAFTPHGTTFAEPVTVTLPYLGSENGLVVLRLDDESDTSWEVLDDGTFSSNVATIAVNRFSLMGVGSQVSAPDPDLDAGPDTVTDPPIDVGTDPNLDTAADSSVEAGDAQDMPDPVSAFTFYASYDRIIDEENQGVNLYNCDVDMSADGSAMVGHAYDEDDDWAFTVDALGSNYRPFVLQNVLGSGADAVAISPDGSRAYVAAHAEDGSDRFTVLFKIEGDTTTRLELRDTIDEGFSTVGAIDTDADGSTIFMRDDEYHHIWSVDHNGQNLVELIDPDDYVEADGTRGLRISELAVDSSGDHIAFIMERWRPPPGQGDYDLQDDIVVWQPSAQFTRVTADDDPEIGKSNILISPDGSRLLWLAWGEDTAFTADFDGTSVESIPNLTGGASAAASGDMSVVFWSNTSFSSSGGATISVDGTGKRELFAATGLDADGALNMSIDGSRIAFTHGYKSSPTTRALYVGWLGVQDDPTDAPDIDWIRMSPRVMPRNDSEAEIVVTVQVADGAGLETVDEVDRAVLRGGEAFGSGEAPVSVSQLRDDGESPDAVAGDGIYTGICRPTSDMATFSDDEVTIRIGVNDVAGNAVVADVALPISP